MPEIAKKALPYLLVTCVILALGFAAYRHGYNQGTTKVRLEWEQDRAALHREYDSLVLKSATEAARQEEVHRVEQERVANELAKVRAESEVAAADLRASYEQRLLQSARRADVYQRQAEAGAASARDLAGHATRLDRALEEGVNLVGELSGALRFREHQLILLGRQIQADREACEGTRP